MAGKAPQGQLTEMNPVKVKAIIHSLRQLYDMGKPETNLELKELICFFSFAKIQASVLAFKHFAQPSILAAPLYIGGRMGKIATGSGKRL